MQNVFVTDHAMLRMQERAGVQGLKNAINMANSALRLGNSPEADPVLAEILDVKLREWPASTFRVLNGVVFVFKKNTLVTVYPLNWANSYMQVAA